MATTTRIDVQSCTYEVVRTSAARLGWTLVAAESDDGSSAAAPPASPVDVIWTDASLAPDEVSAMLAKYATSPLRLNHFPAAGLNCIGTKCGLFRTLKRAKEAFPTSFGFVPPSWSLPTEYSKMKFWMETVGRRKNATLIAKPNSLSRGRGIYLTQEVKSLHEMMGGDAVFEAPEEEGVEADALGQVLVQRYVDDPLLIDGFKFDLRLYVLVTAMPLEAPAKEKIDATTGELPPQCFPRTYLHREGLVRRCTTPYAAPSDENMEQTFMHLTNYSVNKWAAEFLKGGSDAAALALVDALSRGCSLDAAKEEAAAAAAAQEAAAAAGGDGSSDGSASASAAPPALPAAEARRGGAGRGCVPIGGAYLAGAPKGTAIDEPAEVRAIRESTGGSKWTLTAFMQWLDARQEARIAAAGGAPEKGRDADVLWKRLTDLVAKTILAGSVSRMNSNYVASFCKPEAEGGPADASGLGEQRLRCFDLLGFDVLLDEKLKPHVLEVNMGPSLGTASALDRIIKEAVVMESLDLANAPTIPIPIPSADAERGGFARALYESREAHDTSASTRLAGEGATRPAAIGFERVLPPPESADPRRKKRYAEIACFDPDVDIGTFGGSGGAKAKVDPRREAQRKARGAAREKMRLEMWARKQAMGGGGAGAAASTAGGGDDDVVS